MTLIYALLFTIVFGPLIGVLLRIFGHLFIQISRKLAVFFDWLWFDIFLNGLVTLWYIVKR